MSWRVGCDEAREVAPDLALGLLTGHERADVLAHLEHCEACRTEVATLAVAADEVLLAAPEATPPPGFAERVVARVAAERAAGEVLPPVSGPAADGGRADRRAGRHRSGTRPARRSGPGSGGRSAPRPGVVPRTRSALRLLGAAVAGAAIVAAGAMAALVAGDDGETGTDVAVAEMRTGSGRAVGDATAVGGSGATGALVTVDVPGWDAVVDRWGDAPAGSYWLVVETDDGTRARHALAPEVDDWSMRVDAPVDDLATVAMVDAAGRTWCTGGFRPA